MSKKKKQNRKIAIIGMGCIFPKAADLKEFWRVLSRGEDGITEIPETYWSVKDYYHNDPKHPDHTYCTRGGFIPPISYDPTEFGIPPNILEATDTSQLLSLVVAKKALEDAGYGADREFDRDRTSVILGATGTQKLVIPLGARLGHPIWRKALLDSGIETDQAEEVIQRISNSYVSWQESSFPGLLGNVIAGRITNRLNLSGTNCVVDAACASSMGAVHLAMMELISGRCEMTVTGGVDTLNDIFMHMCFSQTGVLSLSSDVMPFSENADGTVLGEGIGLLVLKRLEDAEKDNDRIYAVIRSVGSSSDGKSQSIYAPSATGQAKALRMAYQEADISPETIELIEAHGTGTQVGDAVEFTALKNVFGESGSIGNKCAIGTVKSNIGHAKAAAGAAGLIKQEAAWDGTIAISAISGANRNNLIVSLEDLSKKIAQIKTFEEIIFLTSKTNTHFSTKDDYRIVLVFQRTESHDNQTESALEILKQAIDLLQKEETQGIAVNDIYFSGPKAKAGLAFLFSGQGSQYTGMGKDLMLIFPEMMEPMEKANQEYRTISGKENHRLSDFIFPLPLTETNTNEEKLRSTDIAQPAIGAVSIGMFNILKKFGIQPDAVGGHSFGELTALCASGRIDEDTFLSLAVKRGIYMASAGDGNTTMLAVKAPLADLEKLIQEKSLDVVLANRNTPDQGVLSGSMAAIHEAQKACKEIGFRTTLLPVAAAFHSKFIQKAAKPFKQAVGSAAIKPSKIPVYSNTTGAPYPDDSKTAAAILSDQLLHPVNFVAEIENLYESGVRFFLEVGPKSVLTGLIRSILKGKEFHAASLDSSSGKNSGLADLARTLGRLAAEGYDVDLSKWEKPMREPKKQKMSVMISGSNYRSNYKPIPPRPKTTVHKSVSNPTAAKPPEAEKNITLQSKADTMSAPIATNFSKKYEKIPSKMQQAASASQANDGYVSEALKIVSDPIIGNGFVRAVLHLEVDSPLHVRLSVRGVQLDCLAIECYGTVPLPRGGSDIPFAQVIMRGKGGCISLSDNSEHKCQSHTYKILETHSEHDSVVTKILDTRRFSPDEMSLRCGSSPDNTTF